MKATSSFPPRIDPVAYTELGRSSTSSLAYPDAPPPPAPLFVAPVPPLAPAPPPPVITRSQHHHYFYVPDQIYNPFQL